MLQFSLWKQLKKRLRRGRRGLLALGCVALFMLGAGAAPNEAAADPAAPVPPEPQARIINELEKRDGLIDVTVHRIYICGEETKELGRMRAGQIIRLIRTHPEWTASFAEERRRVVMEQQVEELSPLCRSDIYMGLDRNGNLSLFEGLPRQEKVMRTFFQLDVNYMESSLPKDKLKQLIGGIKINDMDEYNSVLSTFSDYALESKDNNQF
ncbi:BofC C-terminal domain-containing protein [Paenibacillus thailandensis]|uniref:BofC C-terminal domain-containing protein n=1 Tax=Paenibacillus thailandensis TaxID=393250 RepID=A0ABW5QQS4_9BACL